MMKELIEKALGENKSIAGIKELGLHLGRDKPVISDEDWLAVPARVRNLILSGHCLSVLEHAGVFANIIHPK